MDDDLNTSKALAVLFDLAGRANKDEVGAFTILYTLATTLGFSFEKQGLSDEEISNALKVVSEKIGTEFSTMDALIEFRKQARAEKNWTVADAIRISLDECGILLKDSKDGTVIEKK